MHPADHEILKHFRQIRQRTIDLVERIPEEMLTRQADGEAIPLGRLFKHIAYVVDAWMDDFLQDGKGLPRYADDKASILAALESTADRLVPSSRRTTASAWGRSTPRCSTTASPPWSGPAATASSISPTTRSTTAARSSSPCASGASRTSRRCRWTGNTHPDQRAGRT